MLAFLFCALLSLLPLPTQAESTASHPSPASLRDFLSQAYITAYKDYDLQISHITLQLPDSLASLPAPPSCQAPNICSLSPASLARASGTLIARIHNGSSLLSVPISYAIEGELTVLRATRLISSHSDITSHNAEVVRLPLSRVKSPKLLPHSALGRVSARSIIGAGVIITQDKVKERVLVRKGALVTIIIKEENLLLQAQAEALQNGAKGEVIQVRNTSTQKILRARIIAENMAEVL